MQSRHADGKMGWGKVRVLHLVGARGKQESKNDVIVQSGGFAAAAAVIFFSCGHGCGGAWGFPAPWGLVSMAISPLFIVVLSCRWQWAVDWCLDGGTEAGRRKGSVRSISSMAFERWTFPLLIISGQRPGRSDRVLLRRPAGVAIDSCHRWSLTGIVGPRMLKVSGCRWQKT